MEGVLRYILVTSLFILASGTANSAEHLHVNSRHDPQFRNAIGNFLNLHRPELNDIHCMLSGGIDFHVFVKPGESTNRYNMEIFRTQNNSGWATEISMMIEGGKAVPCSFNADSDVWMIEAQ